MGKVSYNKYHKKFEVYFRNGKGKMHVGYYKTKSAAQLVAQAVSTTVVLA